MSIKRIFFSVRLLTVPSVEGKVYSLLSCAFRTNKNLKFTLVFMFFLVFNIFQSSGIGCLEYQAWKANATQPANGFRTYGGSLYQNNGSNGYDGSGNGHTPPTNGHWTLVDACTAVPGLTTNNPSGTTDRTATLHGVVDYDNGSAIIDRGFIYGFNSAHVSSSVLGGLVGTSTAVSEGGSAVDAFSQFLSGLCPGTTVYYKAYATNGTGTGYSTTNKSFSLSTPGIYETVQDGAYSSWATWGGCPPPSTTAGHNIRINHTVTSGTIQINNSTRITVKAGGDYTISPTLRLGTTGQIYVESGGTLYVTGNITGENGNTETGTASTLNIAGGATLDVGGFVEIGNSGNNYVWSGNVDIGGKLYMHGNTHLTIDGGTVDVTGMFDVCCDGRVRGDNGTITYGSYNLLGSGKVICADGLPGQITHNGTDGGCDGTKTCIGSPVLHPDGFSFATCDPFDGCEPIVPGVIISAQTICSGDDVTAFISDTDASGGDEVNWDYQWQSSTTNATSGFANIVGATLANGTYDHGTLSETTWFRRVVTSGSCGGDTTTAIEVTVDPTSVRGEITPDDDDVCTGANGATLTLSGHTGSIVWQRNIAGGGWNAIAGNDDQTTWVYSNLTQTTEYRAVVTSGVCSSVISDTATVTVNPTTVAGTISSAAKVCNGNNEETMSLAGNTGSVTTWVSRVPLGVWNPIAGTAGQTSYTYTNISATTEYRAVVQSGACASDSSNNLTATVVSDIASGSIAANQTIDHGDSPAPLTSATPASGGDGNTYQWQISTDNSTWTDIQDSTRSELAPGDSTNDTWYRRAAIPAASCPTAYTAAVKITVEVNLGCGQSPPDLSVTVPVAGGSGNYTYQWQSSPDNITWTDISGADSAGFDPPSISSTTYYRRGVSDGICGPLYTLGKLATFTGGGAGSPGGVSSGLLVWLKADVGATNSLWQDQSGNGHHYTAVGSPSIVTNGDSASNYQPYVNSTAGGYQAPNGAELGANYTVFTVARKLPSDANGELFESHAGNYYFGFSGNSTEKALVVTSGSTANGNKIDVNHGANGTKDCDAHVYEMIIYNSTLSASEISVISSYLETKYGIEDNDDYVSSASDVVWDVSESTGYNNDIIGLGKECYFHQKQSKSLDDSTVIYVSSLAPSNGSNGGSINNDVSYLMIGHDGALLKGTGATSGEKPAGINTRIDREWKVDNTNFDNTISLYLKWTVNQDSIDDVNDLRLLVDDDGNFSNATVYGPADGLTFTLGSITVGGITTGAGGMLPVGPKFVTIGSTTEDSPLPVEMLSFDVSKQGDGVEVMWTTASEINNDYFIVEKSYNGSTWNSIGQVDGSGNSMVKVDYSFTDIDGCNYGTCYYRIVQVDFDGTTSNSQVKSIDNEVHEVQSELKVFPSPTKSQLNVSFVNDAYELIKMSIYDAQGKEVYVANVVSAEGQNNFTIKVDNLSRGIYHINLVNADGEGRGSMPFHKL